MFLCNKLYTWQIAFYHVQFWAHAYRDQVYHAAVDTNNGNMLKYLITMSGSVTVLNEEFLPEMHHKRIP